MRILLCSPEADGVWFVWLLIHGGHSVSWTLATPEYSDSLQGLVPPPLKSKPDASKYDLIVFDSTNLGEAADDARLHAPTIGGSVIADRLEHDRLFGIEVMEHSGIRVPPWEAFDSPEKALTWLQKTHKRTVLKPIGDVPDKSLTYVSKSEEDMAAFITKRLPGSGVTSFLLQEFIAGTEVSTEGWWNGSEWVAVNYTLEEKKLMSGGLGPNTGCAGNVVWMPPRPTPLFQQGLEKVSPFLVDAPFVGNLDLNAIVTEGAVYGLEWTPRFGYEGTCNLARLLPIEFGAFLYAIATGQTPPNLTPRAKFAGTVRLSVPPYPTKPANAKQRCHLPIKGLEAESLANFFIQDVQCDDEGDGLIVKGDGIIGAPIGLGETIPAAFAAVMSVIQRLDVPDLQYRNDIARCVEDRYLQLERGGWLKPLG